MEKEKCTDKRIMAGNIMLVAAIVLQTVALWNEYAWYELAAPYGTLVSFVVLVAVLFCYVPVRVALKDPYFYLAAAGAVIAGVNLMIVHSGKGAFLTAADVLLVIYLADKIKPSKRLIWIVCAYTGFYFYYWTFDVKGYFKGYNTNYGGLVLITGFVFAVTGLFLFREKLKKDELKGARFLSGFIVFMFAWGYNIIAWYRARCALIGLVVFAVLLLIPAKVWKNKVFYSLLVAASTIGAVAISLLYVWLGKYASVLDVRIFYKDIISGRDAIWSDLWSAFIRMPVTGIGSSYKLNVDWMGGMFEVHNGLLDILIVHGVIVFAITVFMLVRALARLNENAAGNIVSRSAVSAVFAILVASFVENFFIVPPFLLLVLALIAIARSV